MKIMRKCLDRVLTPAQEASIMSIMRSASGQTAAGIMSLMREGVSTAEESPA